MGKILKIPWFQMFQTTKQTGKLPYLCIHPGQDRPTSQRREDKLRKPLTVPIPRDPTDPAEPMVPLALPRW